MRVLVTGGAGFIGSQFVRATLCDEYPWLAGADVTVFDKLTYAGNLENLAPVADSPRYRFVRGDICSALDLDGALPGHDLLINFAAESHVDRSIGAAADFVTTNVLGAQQVFDACLRNDIARVVHVSTDEVYGSIDAGSWTEDHILEPNSPYSAAKAGSDLIARSYAVTYGLDVSITRCSNNYGPYHFPEKVIPLFVTNLLDGLTVPLYGEGHNIRDWLFVADHCRALALVAEKGGRGEIYNIGGGRELSNRELTQQLLDATGRDWSFVEHIVDPRGAGHDLRYSVDYSTVAALGYAPQMTFEDGLALTVEWYRANRAWWEPLRARAAIPGALMLWLVTGAAGQVGSRVVDLLRGVGEDVIASTLLDLDVTSAPDVDATIDDVRPDVVVNTAAYTAVDAAETDEDAALAVNGHAPGHLAASLARHGGRLIHVSTDYVFAGDATTPYEPDDLTRPRTAYGRTKLAGEDRVRDELPGAHHIVRTAWVYGGPGPNFVDTMVRLSGERETLTVVDDQLGSPTWAGDLAEALIALGHSDAAPGTLHYVNAGKSSWYDLARATFAAIGADPERVRPVSSAEFVRPAPRPAWSVLSTASWTERGLPEPRPWTDALIEALAG